MDIKTFFHKDTFSATYVVFDAETKDSVVIDPVRDFDITNGNVSTIHHDLVKSFLNDNGLTLHYIIDTHIHADHLSGSSLLKDDFPSAKTVIGKNVDLVQQVFVPVFNMKNIALDGSQFDLLVDDGDEIDAGSLKFKVITTPGHTPACVSLYIEDVVFVGDAIFMPDFGTGRCDFPKGSAEDLYNSVQKLYALPDETRVFVGHDYGTDNREIQWETTIGDEKKSNIQISVSTSKEEFIKFRTERDAKLKAPKLLLPSIQVNLQAGMLIAPEDNGVRYIKIPLKE